MIYLGVKKILMIVPGIDLVKQGYEDFKEYSEFFNAECIWSGGKVVESSNLTIATYQSLVNFLDKKNKEYHAQFAKSGAIVGLGITFFFLLLGLLLCLSQLLGM